MMPERSASLFVYGTLLPGQGNHRQIESHVRHLRPGTTQGVLHDLGAFPALIHGNGIVQGMVLDVDKEALTITDFIEGCHADRERSLYVREKVEVDLGDGNTMMAWAYFFSNPQRIKDQPKLTAGEVDGLTIFSWPPK